MQTVMPFVIGGLFGAGLYLMMRRSIVKLVIGLVLLGHAANLLVLTAARLKRGAPPIVAAAVEERDGNLVPADLVPAGNEADVSFERADVIPVRTATDASALVDPVPQALILTAIVIGFGLQALALVLIKRAHESVGTDDLDMMRSTDIRH